MLKNRQWLSFVRNHLVLGLLKLVVCLFCSLLVFFSVDHVHLENVIIWTWTHGILVGKFNFFQ